MVKGLVCQEKEQLVRPEVKEVQGRYRNTDFLVLVHGAALTDVSPTYGIGLQARMLSFWQNGHHIAS